MALTLTTSSECSDGIGYAHLTGIIGGSGNFRFELRGQDGMLQQAGGINRASLPLDFDSIYDDEYTLTVFDTADETNQGQAAISLACGYTLPPGGSGPDALILDLVRATDETAAGNDGTATIQAHGGTAPLTAYLVELGLNEPATSGQPSAFSPLPSSTYTLRVVDSSVPPQQVEGKVMVGDYTAPKSGCMDEYALDYDPAATTSDSCTYAPNWRSAWGPSGMAVLVAAAAGQVEAFVAAELRIGFREGHPLHDFRPLGEPIKLRATVMPSGYASFKLGPFLRPQLGVASEGGYRLDLNSATASTSDLYIGYELRRVTGEMLEHGYALNAAVPDEELVDGQRLTPFYPLLPIWPGYDDYEVSRLSSSDMGKYGELLEGIATQYDTRLLPCPSNPLPVRWLAPGSGYGFWVFQSKPTLGDDVGDGQTYTEAISDERRYSERGAAYGTVQASSGIFKGPDLMNGLRTLWASPQVWYKPDVAGPWVPVTIESGSFPAGRVGVLRQEVSITFTEARPHYAQGQ